jgi:hypothetical protein
MAGLALAGCSGSAPAVNNSAAIDAPVAPVETPAPVVAPTPDPIVENSAPAEAGNASATLGGDGSEIVLNKLTRQEITMAGLSGDKACGFFAMGQGEPLLIVKGSADSVRGLVKVAGSIEQVSAPGGFDAVAKGTRFAGKGKTLTVSVNGPPRKDVESARPATMTYDRADGAQRAFKGLWVCGG